MKSRKNSIHQTFLIYLVLVAFISVSSVGYLWISSEWSRFEKHAAALRASYIETQKASLKKESHRALEFVRYMQSQTEKRLRGSVKSRVYEANSIAINIYRQHKDTKSIEKIKEMIKDALRPIRYNKGRGYFFAFDQNGIETLFPVMPGMEGKSMLTVRGGKGEFVVPDMLALIKKKNEGFYSYTWPKPGTEGFFPKIAFVKLIEPIGWVIGTGEYLDDVEKDIQEECLKWISNIRFGKDGYVFAGNWDGLSLSGPATGKDMYDVEDINGVKIVQELIKAARSGDGFVHYVLPKFKGKKHAPKISYAVGIREWQWYIGSGVYVDEIETAIALRQADLESRIRTNIRNTFFILVSMILIFILIVKLLSDRIQHNVKMFVDFFRGASSDAIKIEQHTLHFSEFIVLAESANEMLDIRKRDEAALHTSQRRFLTVLDSIDATIYVSDMETYEILFMNKYMKEAFGRDMTGEICWEVFRGKSKPCLHCTNDQLIDDNGKPAGLCVWQDKNPVIGKWYINYDRAIEWTDGRLAKIQIATDITNLKKMEKDLQQAQRFEAIGTLASGIAHDFNNLMMGIQGRSSLIMMDLKSSHPHIEHIKAIEEYVQSATYLTNQLLGLARGGKYDVKPIDVNELVLSSSNMFGRTKREIRILTDFHEQKTVVEADRSQIEQVLLNMYINAWQAMPKHGTITLETKIVNLDHAYCKPHEVTPGRFVEISIMDTGTGMDDSTRQRIFDPFFTTKETSHGTGLGLASAYGIIKNHGGMITVDSEMGHGTTFNIYLPLSAHEVNQETVTEGTMIKGSETILLVDDDKMIIDVSQAILERLGYRILTAGDGNQAVKTVREIGEKIDLVILDMIMPGMDGSTTFDRIREIKPQLPVILSSGYAINGKAEEIMRRGCNGFIQKPFNISVLSGKVRKILDG